jgi:hypothetical protein
LAEIFFWGLIFFKVGKCGLFENALSGKIVFGLLVFCVSFSCYVCQFGKFGFSTGFKWLYLATSADYHKVIEEPVVSIPLVKKGQGGSTATWSLFCIFSPAYLVLN